MIIPLDVSLGGARSVSGQSVVEDIVCERTWTHDWTKEEEEERENGGDKGEHHHQDELCRVGAPGWPLKLASGNNNNKDAVFQVGHYSLQIVGESDRDGSVNDQTKWATRAHEHAIQAASPNRIWPAHLLFNIGSS